MDAKGLQERVRELAKSAGLSENPGRCWVDGHVTCPYGSPEGQYILRPRFCDQSCATFADTSNELFTQSDVDDMADDELRNHFNENHSTITAQLKESADYLEKQHKPTEKLVLLLAIDILEANKQNADILLRDKLPGE